MAAAQVPPTKEYWVSIFAKMSPSKLCECTFGEECTNEKCKYGHGGAQYCSDCLLGTCRREPCDREQLEEYNGYLVNLPKGYCAGTAIRVTNPEIKAYCWSGCARNHGTKFEPRAKQDYVKKSDYKRVDKYDRDYKRNVDQKPDSALLTENKVLKDILFKLLPQRS